MSKIEEALAKIQSKPRPGGGSEPLPRVDLPAAMNVDRDAFIERRIVTAVFESGPAVEEYKKLRTRVLAWLRSAEGNVVMLASAGGKEGKSLTAVNLAVSVARELHQTALLIDADLRRPHLHQLLDVKGQPGLSDFLMGQGDLSSLFHSTGIPKLTLVPAGTPTARSPELLASQRMAEFLKEVRRRYQDRIVILDAPPVLPATDSVILANHADGIVFVVRAGGSAREDVQQAVRQFDPRKVIGVALNGAADTGHYSAYGYHYVTSPVMAAVG